LQTVPNPYAPCKLSVRLAEYGFGGGDPNLGAPLWVKDIGMNIGGLSASNVTQTSPSRVSVDRDGDHDNDATESSAAKAQETGGSSTAALPADPNRGRALNISA